MTCRMEFSNKTEAETAMDHLEQHLAGLHCTLELVGGRWRLELRMPLCGAGESVGLRQANLTACSAHSAGAA
jgi:hypothetical protein